jgi:CII-binding regulator of phage lambda lysogenization HflD
LLKANSRRKKMVVELWLNLEILERSLSEKEEKARLIRELINTIERNEIIVGKVDDIEYLKVSN